MSKQKLRVCSTCDGQGSVEKGISGIRRIVLLDGSFYMEPYKETRPVSCPKCGGTGFG